MKYLIGFRTRKPKRMIIAVLFYLFAISGMVTGLRNGVSFFLFCVGFLYFAFGIVEAINMRRFSRLLYVASAVVMLSCSAIIMPSAEEVPVYFPPLATEAAPTPALYSEHTPAPTADPNIVWITKSGEKYHTEDCGTLRSTKQAVTIEEAVAMGKEPCSRCLKQ